MNNTIEVLSNQFEEGNVNAFASVAAEFGVTPAIYEEMASKAKPAVHLISATTDTDFSKLGGKPNLGPDFTWPCFNGKPMSFIGQFNLSDIPSVRDFDLPATGYLYFFYDQTNMAWGFNPEEKGSSKVIYVKEYAAIPAETAFPADLPETAQFQEKRIGFKKKRHFC